MWYIILYAVVFAVVYWLIKKEADKRIVDFEAHKEYEGAEFEFILNNPLRWSAIIAFVVTFPVVFITNLKWIAMRPTLMFIIVAIMLSGVYWFNYRFSRELLTRHCNTADEVEETLRELDRLSTAVEGKFNFFASKYGLIVAVIASLILASMFTKCSREFFDMPEPDGYFNEWTGKPNNPFPAGVPYGHPLSDNPFPRD